jgi:integrase/recombinase XerC/integrase/recombinase XerD
MEIPCDTIGQAVAGYLEAGDFSHASRTTYARVLVCMARALGPGRAVTDLDAAELAAWFERTRSAHAPATWNRDRVIVRAFVRHLQRQGVTVQLPALEHRRLRPDTTRALPRARVEELLSAAAPLRDKTLWRLLYESAARVGEVLALDVEDLDLPNRRARVTGKGGQVEWITWSTGTATLLPRLLKGRRSGPVFTTRRPSRTTPAVFDRAPDGTTRLSYRRAEELFKAAAGATLHQLRHSALTHMAEDGASAPMLMTKSRHQSITSLARYARPGVEALQRWEAEHDPTRRRHR